MIVLSAPRRPAFFFDAVRTLLWCDRGFSDLNIKEKTESLQMKELRSS